MADDPNKSVAENKKAEMEANAKSNEQTLDAAADVAIASGHPVAAVVGGAYKAANQLTGGAVGKVAGKATAKALNSPLNLGGQALQKGLKKGTDSGATQAVGKVAAAKNAMSGGGATGKGTGGMSGNAPAGTKGAGNAPGNTPNQVKNNNTSGGGQQNGSLPSSPSENGGKNGQPNGNGSGEGGDKKGGGGDSSGGGMPSRKSSTSSEEEEQQKENSPGTFMVSKMTKIIIMLFLPTILFFGMVIILLSIVVGVVADYDDALGVSSNTGRDTGDVSYSARTTEQQEFFERVNDVELDYLANGIKIDSTYIAATYHILESNGAKISYNTMDEAAIREIADAMGGYFNEETFKSNLISNIFPKYLPDSSDSLREQMADDVIDYVNRYYSFIGKDPNDSSTLNAMCTSSGSCSYDIKGFYIQGKGNVAKPMQVSDIYVRLMQCGTGNGHNYGGTFGQPLAGEDLVPFEKYILGVAYQEIGPDAPAEAIKAQMVAARSYILARHVDMGGWRTLKQENGKWILQAASCTQDQVYCDPDKGCSSNDGQWGQVHSGTNHGPGFVRQPMSQDSPLRAYANQTNGEVLVNSQGYIVYAGYVQTEQNKFISLAKSGLNYKQILLQVYNQGSRNYGASDVIKSSCGGSANSNCGAVSTGEFANWKQSGASWSSIPVGTSGSNIGQIGCLVTSVSMLVAKSGVPVNISPFNPGTFVEFLNKNGGFQGGNYVWASVSKVAPTFKYVGYKSVSGMSREQKLSVLKELLSQPNTYVVAEVKGSTGQHWVAVDSISGNTINMMDPASNSTDMWSQYNWANTSQFSYFKVG